MRVFIGWGGDLSREVARLLHGWLPSTIHAITPWMSDEDTAKGARWFEEIRRNLQAADYGIVVLTWENRERPWINFEAGAIASRLERNHVSALLVDLPLTEVVGPLKNFQHTDPADRDDMMKLLLTLNGQLPPDRSLPMRGVEESFEKWWPDFKAAFEGLRADEDLNSSHREPRDLGEILEDVLTVGRQNQYLLLERGRFLESVLTDLIAESGVLTSRELKVLVLMGGLHGERRTAEEVGNLFALGEAAVTDIYEEAVLKLARALGLKRDQ